ncbi:hypothetical protein IIC45_00745 [Patescibacteria group bacterium]|nr:hypothetical protein [Patescibacteria group bacterium]
MIAFSKLFTGALAVLFIDVRMKSGRSSSFFEDFPHLNPTEEIVMRKMTQVHGPPLTSPSIKIGSIALDETFVEMSDDDSGLRLLSGDGGFSN